MTNSETFNALLWALNQNSETRGSFGAWCLQTIPEHQGSDENLSQFKSWLENLIALPALRATITIQAAEIADLKNRLEALEHASDQFPSAPNKRPWE